MSAVTVGRARVAVEVNGLKLELVYESQNLMELSRLVGCDPVTFIERIRRGASNVEEAGLRVSDLGVLVPLLAAGLCHHREYENLSDRDMRRRLCSLIDAEVAKQRSGIIAVCAGLAAKIVPVFVASLQPPTAGADQTEEASEPGPLSPVAETPSPGAS